MPSAEPSPKDPPRRPVLRLLLAWAAVGLPLGWGIYQTVVKASQLFR